jgi:hypothetical protein
LIHFAAVAEEESFTAEPSVQTSLERRIAFELSELNTLLVSCPINNIAFVAIKMGRRQGVRRAHI